MARHDENPGQSEANYENEGSDDNDCCTLLAHGELLSADYHFTDLQGRSSNGAHKRNIVAQHFDVLQHLSQIAGDSHLLNRVHELSIFDPKSDRATGIIASYRVYTEADQLYDVKSPFHRLNDLFRS